MSVSIITFKSGIIYITITSSECDCTTITRILSTELTSSIIVSEDSITYCTIITLPSYTTSRTSSYIMFNSTIDYSTIITCTIPTKCTTIPTSNIICKGTALYSCIITMNSTISILNYNSTTI